MRWSFPQVVTQFVGLRVHIRAIYVQSQFDPFVYQYRLFFVCLVLYITVSVPCFGAAYCDLSLYPCLATIYLIPSDTSSHLSSDLLSLSFCLSEKCTVQMSVSLYMAIFGQLYLCLYGTFFVHLFLLSLFLSLLWLLTFLCQSFCFLASEHISLSRFLSYSTAPLLFSKLL